MGMEEQREWITDLMRFARSLPEQSEWVARRIEVKPVASGVEMMFTESDGEKQYVGSAMCPPDEEQLVRTLQQDMYNPERGTWVSAHFDVMAAGSGDARFNYDDAPEPILTGPGLEPADAADHLRRFPRLDGAPKWLAEAASQA